MPTCLDPAETLIGAFDKRCSVAVARRTSPSHIATIVPPLGGFGSGEGSIINIMIYIVTISQVSVDRAAINMVYFSGGAACGHGCVALPADPQLKRHRCHLI